jgi:hypothetical protein
MAWDVSLTEDSVRGIKCIKGIITREENRRIGSRVCSPSGREAQ